MRWRRTDVRLGTTITGRPRVQCRTVTTVQVLTAVGSSRRPRASHCKRVRRGRGPLELRVASTRRVHTRYRSGDCSVSLRYKPSQSTVNRLHWLATGQTTSSSAASSVHRPNAASTTACLWARAQLPKAAGRLEAKGISATRGSSGLTVPELAPDDSGGAVAPGSRSLELMGPSSISLRRWDCPCSSLSNDF